MTIMKTGRFALIVLLTATSLPFTAAAAPKVGDTVGQNAKDATAALQALGCEPHGFEAEDGQIEAKCVLAKTGQQLEVYIDPASGRISRVKADD